jgi:hypothetical protein
MKCSLMLTLVLCLSAPAQPPATNYDESKVGTYTLPDPLKLEDGGRVRDAKTWQNRRRAEVLRLFETQMFGRAPGRPEALSFEMTSIDKSALNGTAIRKEIAIHIAGKKTLNLLIYLPAKARGRVPVFVGLNFGGNQSVAADPGIRLAQVWTQDRRTKAVSAHTADEKTRGAAAGRWQVEKILERGYGLATMYYGDIEPDIDGAMQYGVRPLFFKAGQTEPAPDEWGAIAAWAWGLSRAMDYLATDPAVDAKRVAVMGHSRLGKTALWAGATDPRFALVISNESGEGGAAISRRNYGETVANLNARFPHWFCGNYKQYSERVNDLPFDSHMLIALMAPRPVYVASAEGDQWSDPHGEFLGAQGADPVYALFGKKGIGSGNMPGIEQPVGDTVRYHNRAGKHDVTAYDWEQYLDFADRQLGKR